jgi:hypothetical protein
LRKAALDMGSGLSRFVPPSIVKDHREIKVRVPRVPTPNSPDAAAVEGAAAARVTAGEVRTLILTAQGAWRRQRELGLTDDAFEVWRKGVLWDAVRKASFRSLGQREYGVALAAFLRLGGKALPARAAVARRETGPEGDRRRAEWKLRRECEAWEDVFGSASGALDYACSVIRDIHKLPQGRELSDATAKQIWQALFTLRNRGGVKRRAAAAATKCKR